MKFTNANLYGGKILRIQNATLSINSNGLNFRVFNDQCKVVCQIENPSIQIAGNGLFVDGFGEIAGQTVRIRFEAVGYISEE